MPYDISDLRQDLADTIRAVRDRENPLDVNRAKAVADLAQVMINSAKVEVDMINAIGRRGMQPTGFIALASKDTLDEQDASRPAIAQEREEKPKPHIRNPVGTSPRGSLVT